MTRRTLKDLKDELDLIVWYYGEDTEYELTGAYGSGDGDIFLTDSKLVNEDGKQVLRLHTGIETG